MELQVINSPFTQEQTELLNRLLPTFSETQRIWLSGYLTAIQASGVAATSMAEAPALNAVGQPAAPAPAISKEITVLFGSQTGNSSGIAKKFSKKLQEQGFEVTTSSMSDFKPNNLRKVQNLLIVISTHGEGEPPDSAIAFHEFLYSKRAPKLDDLKFSVLALGDTSYEFFCQTGKDFDKRLEELGGSRLTPRVDCDVDFEESAAEWMNQVLSELSTASALTPVNVSSVGAAASTSTESEFTRSNPFQAEVLENLNLNGRGSDRETRHIELSLEGSGLSYEPGDSLGIIPQNHPLLVEEIIAAAGWNGQEVIQVSKKGDTLPLNEALTTYFEITVLTKPLLEQIVNLTSNAQLRKLVEPGNEQELRNYINDHDLLDLIQDFNLRGVTASEFVSLLRKIPARLYSIASSPSAYPDEVHLTVRTVRYQASGRDRYGVCSVQLAERIEPGDQLPVFIQNNDNFKLPANPDAPIIMIGPGTGVAPFRAFLGEREEQGAGGKSWLFYGDQHFATDFLYQVEWQRWLADGVLTRMDVAFSRDTDEKVYVQHRMLERSRELYEWLQEGAYIYVCGDEKKMAHDVHSTLGAILVQEGGMTMEAATDYLIQLKQDKRYQRDVY
ncbi:assimilatory sulfite reductase (NADPH) flavoprotein subunit [Paenibacillus provencensis]|uniref:Assimilatory sulfite reductase (NADPH) flavoprotein subunit n=1 Tax=Paenibacillus provencensis TaxID=441151 RepID=A0ABW3PP65_9BACL|nr:assimilatory sulfite reductase (NADPH) flavoprotein subunit [Paenibacillus sp. MER 78]MCM3129609.1 assimilatory sulfite reductase (NADPH) flavoprotein subunit [Paenibacillus sp. MER 78]